MVDNNNINIESRFEEIKRLILNYSTNDSTVLSIDGLLDALLVLYDECCNATLKREKTIIEFLEYGNNLFYEC
jgi:serine/threonine-protein kinase MRCK